MIDIYSQNKNNYIEYQLKSPSFIPNKNKSDNLDHQSNRNRIYTTVKS